MESDVGDGEDSELESVSTIIHREVNSSGMIGRGAYLVDVGLLSFVEPSDSESDSE